MPPKPKSASASKEKSASTLQKEEDDLRDSSEELLRKRFRVKSVAAQIEEGCYNFAIDYCDAHSYAEDMILPFYKDRINDIAECARDIVYVQRVIANDFKVGDDSSTNIGEKKDDSSSSSSTALTTQPEFRYVSAREIAYLQHHQLDGENWDALISRKKLREEKMKNASTTDAYPCRKCKKRKAYVFRFQTRSADEPMTTFIRCLVCGNTQRQ